MSPSTPLTNRWAWTVVTAAMFLGVIVYHRATDVPIGLMVRDPNQVAQGRAWTGIVSTIGNALWVVSASVALFARRFVPTEDEPARRALLVLGTFSVILFIDDSLLFHDAVLPDLGVPELAISVAYALLGVTVFVIALPLLRRTGALPTFLAAVIMLATSVLVDLFDPREWWGPNGVFAVEDGAKFIGIGLWTDAILRMSRELSAAQIPPKEAG